MTAEVAARFTRANRDIRALVTRDIKAWWRLLPEDPRRAAAATVEFLPDLTAAYGDVAATVAADYYNSMRAAAGAPGGFHAALAANSPVAQVAASTRWAVGPLFAGDRAGALGRAVQVADRYSLQPGRDTVTRAVREDPARPRYARVPQGDTCAWCLMLASRGAVYLTARTADAAWHAQCDCRPTPIYDGQPLPEGYDPEALYDRYLDAREQSGSHRTKAILSKLREIEGIH